MHQQEEQQLDQTFERSIKRCLIQLYATLSQDLMKDEQENEGGAIGRTEFVAEIVKDLEEEKVRKVVLHGKHGVGKTWTAKEVAQQAISKNIVDFTIWVYNKRFQYSSVFHQLSVQYNNLPGSEYYCDINTNNGVNQDSLISFWQQNLKGKKYLLILDNNDNGAEDYPMPELNQILSTSAKELSKVIITTSTIIDGDHWNDDGIVDKNIEPLTLSEAKILLQRNWNENQLLSEDDLKRIVAGCKYFPASIAFTGSVLSYAIENAPQEIAIQEAKKDVKDYLSSGFKKFRNVATARCLWLSTKYLIYHGCINYNELILFWMLDGCLDSATTTEQAYVNGHNILTDLLDAGLLWEGEAGDVVLKTAGLKFAEHNFLIVLDEFHTENFCDFYQFSRGNLELMNGAISVFMKTGLKNFEKGNLMTLLAKGNSSSKLDQSKIDPYVTESIRILSLSHWKLNISDLHHKCPFLLVLILKDCCSLNDNNISEIGQLTSLLVLDISGCSSLKKIPKEFLSNFEFLESLNMSDIPIRSFPRPTSNFALSNLRSLFMRRCTELKSFPDVSGLGELRMLDVSGANFKSFNVMTAWFTALPQLVVLDLSETNIYEFPNFVNLEKLDSLILKNCSVLNKIRPSTAFAQHEATEPSCSSSSNLEYFAEVNGHCLIRKLDFTGTKLSNIPPLRNASNLVYLSMKGCCHLKELPPIGGAKNLRILDVSDAIELEIINTSFEEMKSLEELLLSNTNIKSLPPLSDLESLRMLILEGCKSLASLPDVHSLTNLLFLDLRGCKSLASLPDVHSMTNLLLLDLRGCESLAPLPDAYFKQDVCVVLK